MKGVILSRCPEARITDLTHEVDPGQIRPAAYLLNTAWPYYPKGTVHTVVVDPGVGGERAALAAEAGGHWFVAPDNGVLSEVFEDAPPDRVVRVENEAYFVKPVSRTFHGRDIFSPAAAALAGGVDPGGLGPVVKEWVHPPRPEPEADGEAGIRGEVIYVDRFGNLVTNVPASALSAGAQVEIGERQIEGLQRSYDAVPPGALLALIGSTDRLEISINGGRAAAELGVRLGAPVRVRPGTGKGSA
jgi:S-adenosylmethionine hydrolase